MESSHRRQDPQLERPPLDSEAGWRIDRGDRQVDIHFARVWGTRVSRDGHGGESLVFAKGCPAAMVTVWFTAGKFTPTAGDDGSVAT